MYCEALMITLTSPIFFFFLEKQINRLFSMFPPKLTNSASSFFISYFIGNKHDNIQLWLLFFLRPPRGVCEPHLHQAYKPCFIIAIPSQTYCNIFWRSSKLPLGGRCASSAPFKQYTITHRKNAGPTFVPLIILDLHLT